jgi:glycosyltransferase involved in cell wall biosynthesis
MSFISFFIPAYNCSETIAEAVDSIMETNFNPGDELLIVNDCSTDKTAEVLLTLKAKYPVIDVVSHKINKGGAATRNTAVENSKNDLLFCLDSDNVLAASSIKGLKKHLLDSEADVASFQEMRYFSSQTPGDTKYTWKFLTNTTLADFMADNKNPGSSGNYLFTRRSYLQAKGYPEFAGALDTWGFCFRQLATGAKVISLPNSCYFHRFGGESYYIRDMNSRNMSIIALQIILPFYELIEPQDLDYIMGKENRLSWFDDLEKRPVRIINSKPGVRAANINTTDVVTRNLLSKVYYKIKNAF